jgi:hypothetical protein
MSPFRLFGPTPESEPVGALADTGSVNWAPGAWAGDPAPATRHARPVGLDVRSAPRDLPDPPTDPYGFPPIPSGLPPSWSAPPKGPGGRPPDPQEAAALAGAFAADYLSWDEDDAGRRGRALADHLGTAAGDPALLGWTGVGRQRAEIVLPGAVRPDGDDRVLVDVRVRVTPYRVVGERTADEPGSEPDVPGVPAAAPAPAGSGWQGCASYWVRLIVPVVRDDGRLVVDAGEEALADEGQEADDDPRSDLLDTPAPSRPGVARVADREPEPDGAW